MSGTDLLPALPANRELARELPSAVLYALERAGEISRGILDERVAEWAASGWTQASIADEVGCTARAISKRMTRLGITPAHPEKRRTRPRLQNPVPQTDPPAIADATDFDPRTEAICPRCHGTGLVPASEA